MKKCMIPHSAVGYDYVLSKFGEVAKRKAEQET